MTFNLFERVFLFNPRYYLYLQYFFTAKILLFSSFISKQYCLSFRPLIALKDRGFKTIQL